MADDDRRLARGRVLGCGAGDEVRVAEFYGLSGGGRLRARLKDFDALAFHARRPCRTFGARISLPDAAPTTSKQKKTRPGGRPGRAQEAERSSAPDLWLDFYEPLNPMDEEEDQALLATIGARKVLHYDEDLLLLRLWRRNHLPQFT